MAYVELDILRKRILKYLGKVDNLNAARVYLCDKRTRSCLHDNSSVYGIIWQGMIGYGSYSMYDIASMLMNIVDDGDVKSWEALKQDIKAIKLEGI